MSMLSYNRCKKIGVYVKILLMSLTVEQKDKLLGIKPRFFFAIMLPFALCIALGIYIWRLPFVWQDFFIFFVFYQVALFGISVGNHRYFSHKSFKATPFFEFLLFFSSAVAFQTPAICWAAVHRKHHHHSDKGDDPHSPYFKEGMPLSFWEGFWHAHVMWIFGLDTLGIIKKYTQDLYHSERLVKWHRFHMLIGISFLIIPGFIEAAMLGEFSVDNILRGVFWGGLFRVMLLHNAVFLINSWGCHRGIGYRRNETSDQSTNNPLLFPFILGEAWHNNHHGSQTSANNAQKSIDIDPHFWMLKGFEKLGWVSDIKDAHKS